MFLGDGLLFINSKVANRVDVACVIKGIRAWLYFGSRFDPIQGDVSSYFFDTEIARKYQSRFFRASFLDGALYSKRSNSNWEGMSLAWSLGDPDHGAFLFAMVEKCGSDPAKGCYIAM